MKKILLANFERTLQMLGRAIDDCPDQLWDASDEAISIWQYAYHCLIGLDVFLRERGRPFVPLAFHNNAGGNLAKGQGPVMTRDQIAGYRDEVYARNRDFLNSTPEVDFIRDVEIMGARLSLADLVMDQIRHVQHHVGAMHTQLRRHLGSAPPWVGLG